MKSTDETPVDLMRRKILLGTGGAAITLGELIWPDDALAQPAAPQPKRGDTLVYTNTYPNNRMGDARTARHPHNWLDLNNRSAYNALAWVDEKMEVQPELAKGWTASPDMKVWEIALREDVVFHDGRPMTADDVVSSYNFHVNATSYAKKISKVEKVSTHKVRMLLTEADSEFPYTLAEYHMMIMPAAEPETIGLSGIGTGPFRIVNVDPKRRITMERNEKYWRSGYPYLDKLEVVSSPGRMESALNGIRGNMFDVVVGVDPGMGPELRSIPNIKVAMSTSGDQALMILPKYEGSVFNDKRIRQALALAIDREKIIRIVYGADAGWAGNDSHLTPSENAFLPRPVKRDVAKAKALLAAAGHSKGITLPTFYFSATWPEIPRVFQVLAESVKEAGITLPIEQRPSDGYRQWRVEDKEGTRKHRFAYGPSGPRNPGVSLYRMRPDSNESGYWSGPECDAYMRLYHQALTEADAGKRRVAYQQMQRILHEEVPAIHPVGRRNVLIHKANVHGLLNHSQFWSIRFDSVWKS